MPRGLVVAAPRTGSGKTTVTLALLRAFSRRGVRVASGKIGPDFIDPRFHEAASGRECVTLDGWAMRPALIRALAAGFEDSDLVLIEGVMGLFDGASRPGLGTGATAEMAKRLGLPVVLVVDAAGSGQSIAALVEGFCRHDPEVTIVGIVLNNVSSARHRRILDDALRPTGVHIFGMLPREPTLVRPSRHLGLVQAGEADDLDAFLDAAAETVRAHLDLDALHTAAGILTRGSGAHESVAEIAPLPPPGRRIALASDAAFAFVYPYMLAFWRAAGAEILPFSPLDDQPPDPEADAIWLPGGYPELHAGRLAAAGHFRSGMIEAARRNCAIHGECGGYMVLGEGIVDGQGRRHEMLGLLPLETNFAERRLHLGYRHVALIADSVLGNSGAAFRGHEFHYSVATREEGQPLFKDVDGTTTYGLAHGRITGSYLHIIDRQGMASASEDRKCPMPKRHDVVQHGGDLRAAETIYGRHDWLDLSTGINPVSYPVPDLPAETWTRLPEADALADLLATARKFYRASGSIVAAPGTQAILHALPGLFPDRPAAYVAPGYGGYREAWTSSLRGVPAPVPDAADILIVGRPNNPDGRLPPAGALLDIADHLARRNGLLVVDEAFADPTPEMSLAAEAGRPGLLVLRSFGKFFGLAGLRLGFALGEPALIARLAARFGSWAVHGPALILAGRAFEDHAWIEETRDRLPRAAARLDALLARAGFASVGGTPLFRLVAAPEATNIHVALARAGIWTRRFEQAPTWLRFGLPGSEADWIRLETTLSATTACLTSTSAI